MTKFLNFSPPTEWRLCYCFSTLSLTVLLEKMHWFFVSCSQNVNAKYTRFCLVLLVLIVCQCHMHACWPPPPKDMFIFFLTFRVERDESDIRTKVVDTIRAHGRCQNTIITFLLNAQHSVIKTIMYTHIQWKLWYLKVKSRQSCAYKLNINMIPLFAKNCNQCLGPCTSTFIQFLNTGLEQTCFVCLHSFLHNKRMINFREEGSYRS